MFSHHPRCFFLSVRYVQSKPALLFSFGQVCSVTTRAAFFFRSGMFSHHPRCFFLSVKDVQSPPALLFSFSQVCSVTICTAFFFQSGMFSHHRHCFFLSGHRETATGSTAEKTAAGRGKETGQKEKEETGILMFFSFPQLVMMIHIQCT